ncbi:MAG: hypothetical protein AB1631_16285 [Acidobacteriota bacterium]
MSIESSRDSGGLLVTFRVRHPVCMLIEVRIDGGEINDESSRRSFARIERIIANSRYGFVDHHGCDECEWHAVMAIIRHCLKEAEIAGCRAATRALSEEQRNAGAANAFAQNFLPMIPDEIAAKTSPLT